MHTLLHRQVVWCFPSWCGSLLDVLDSGPKRALAQVAILEGITGDFCITVYRATVKDALLLRSHLSFAFRNIGRLKQCMCVLHACLERQTEKRVRFLQITKCST